MTFLFFRALHTFQPCNIHFFPAVLSPFPPQRRMVKICSQRRRMCVRERERKSDAVFYRFFCKCYHTRIGEQKKMIRHFFDWKHMKVKLLYCNLRTIWLTIMSKSDGNFFVTSRTRFTFKNSFWKSGVNFFFVP